MHFYLDVDALVKLVCFPLWAEKVLSLSSLNIGGNRWSFSLVQNSFSASVLLKCGGG